MKHLIKNIKFLLNKEALTELTIKKVEDSKVELWSDGIYYGRLHYDQSVNNKKKKLLKKFSSQLTNDLGLDFDNEDEYIDDFLSK